MILIAWTDELADVIRRKFDIHKYRIMDSVKSFEGFIEFFIVGVLSSFARSSFFKAYVDATLTRPLLLISIPIADIATVIESLSHKETDNLTVPIVSSFLLYAIV